MELNVSNIASMFIIGGLFVLAIFHVLMYFLAGHRKAHLIGLCSDICMIFLMSFAGASSVWGYWAVDFVGEKWVRTFSFWALCILFNSLAYAHAVMAKIRRHNTLIYTITPILGGVLGILGVMLDLQYFGILRKAFYVLTFALDAFVLYQLFSSYRRGDSNSLWLIISFSIITVFFSVAVCYDFANHSKSYLDYLFLFLVMLSLDVNMIVNTGFKLSAPKQDTRFKNALNKQIEDLQTSNQSKDKFLSIIAHDLKNPIASIKMLSDLYVENSRDKGSAHDIDMAVALSDSIDNLYKLLDNLLTWTRTQNDTIKFEPRLLEVNNLVEHLHYSVESLCNAKNIELKVAILDGQDIYGDENMVQTVLRNLITNSVKFSYPDSFIDLIFDSDESCHIIKVCDNGVGMSGETIDRLFRIDRIASTNGTQKEQGTGLGLILCNEFVSRHHGKIDVTTQEGLGTTFSVRLPKK